MRMGRGGGGGEFSFVGVSVKAFASGRSFCLLHL